MRALPLLLAMLAVPAVAAEPQQLSEDRFVSAVERAIAGGRLVQADAMLAKMPAIAGPAMELLRAALALARREDATAFAMYERIRTDNPGNCRVAVAAGIAALHLGRDADAEARLVPALSNCSDDANGWGALAMVRDRQGRWTESDSAYRKALALDPDSPGLLNNAGMSLLAQGHAHEAMSYFQQALSVAPANRRAANNLDIARVAAGERPQFDKDEDPTERAQRLNNAGFAALAGGDSESARRYFRQAIRDYPFRFDVAEANLEALTSKDRSR